MARQRIASLTDLLRDFAFSRTVILRAVQSGPVNTDTNLISEVRLARIGGGGGDSTSLETLLASVRGLDLAPHLPRESAPQVLEDLAKALEQLGRADDARTIDRRRSAQPPQPLELR